MHSKNWYKLISFLALVLMGLVLLFSWEGRSSIIAQGQEATIRLIRVIDIDDVETLEEVGLAYSPGTNEFLVLDAVTASRINKAAIYEVDPSKSGLGNMEVFALDPGSGHFHVVNPTEGALYEISAEGQVMTVRDLGAVGVSDPQSMVFAPSSDSADDPAQMNLYVADGEQIVELSIKAIAVPLVTSYEATLVNTIDTSVWAPPSPDPSGAVYLPQSDRLLVSDSEVNEMPIYVDVNQYESSLAGALVRTFTTEPWSNEPAGVTVDPVNKHLYYVDDTFKKAVYELDPGPDMDYGTIDDVDSLIFLTSDFGSDDPMGVTYVPKGTAYPDGALFIADMASHEVYEVTPGANKVFDGVAPGGDDAVTSFDTAVHGLTLPEGIVHNPDNGNLLVIGKPAWTLFEFTAAGVPVRTFDLKQAKPVHPAGLAYGPHSSVAGKKSVYIAARGVDNNVDPLENDGKVYEMTLPNVAPVAVDDPGATTAKNSPTTIDVAANDTDVDGNLNPATANTSCTYGSLGCANPMHGVLQNNNNGTFGYTPNLNYVGIDTFVYEICDTGGLCDTATVTIDVTQTNAPPVAKDDSFGVQANTTKTFPVAANDTDPDGNLDITSANTGCLTCSLPVNGNLTNNNDGSFDYMPDTDYVGTDSFVYEICDTAPLCDTATVSITVTEGPPPPDQRAFLPIVIGR